jgi:hypothetical protein
MKYKIYVFAYIKLLYCKLFVNKFEAIYNIVVLKKVKFHGEISSTLNGILLPDQI